jgi:hypothetical protein
VVSIEYKKWNRRQSISKLVQFLKITDLWKRIAIRRALMRLKYAYATKQEIERLQKLTTAGSKATREGEQCSVDGRLRARGRRWGRYSIDLMIRCHAHERLCGWT